MMALKRIVPILCTGAAIGLSACGSVTTKTVTVHDPAPSSTVSTAASTSAAGTVPSVSTTTSSAPTPTDCASKGINDVQLKTGSCTSNGYHYTVVDKDESLKLKSLTAHYNGVRTADSLSSDGGGQTATAHGEFVIISLTISNRLDSAQQIGSSSTDQVFLSLGSKHTKTYSDAFDAENGPDQQSCEWTAGSISQGIQPGESQTCDIVFDVPPSLVHTVDASGNIGVVNFGSTIDTAHTVGIIRTYH